MVFKATATVIDENISKTYTYFLQEPNIKKARAKTWKYLTKNPNTIITNFDIHPAPGVRIIR